VAVFIFSCQLLPLRVERNVLLTGMELNVYVRYNHVVW